MIRVDAFSHLYVDYPYQETNDKGKIVTKNRSFWELPETTQLQLRYKAAMKHVQMVGQMMCDFSDEHGEAIDGNPKKKIPPSPTLRLMRELLKRELNEHADIATALMQRAYKKEGDRFTLDKNLIGD